MRLALLMILLLPFPALAETSEAVFHNCSIFSRYSTSNGILSKFYKCKEGVVMLQGEWSINENGYRKEFGEFIFGESHDFGNYVAKPDATFFDCLIDGKSGNPRGYMTDDIHLTCGTKIVTLQGLWGEEYQGNWSYDLSLGEVTRADWVDDPKRDMDFSSNFQKWCPTTNGYKLCGWIEKPTVDHGKAPPFVRSAD